MAILNDQPAITIRDGVTIDTQKGAAEDGKKFDYEILEPGAEFAFSAEITIREGMDPTAVLRIARWMQERLVADLQVGGNTTKGFGRMSASGLQCWLFDFGRKEVADAWFQYCSTGKVATNFPPITLDNDIAPPLHLAPAPDFTLQAAFTLQSALIIGAAALPDDETDKSHLRSNGVPVIPGRSLIGAMRNRASKILKTIGIDDTASLIDRLFGQMGDKNKELTRSRIATREAAVGDAGKHGRQTRIRVDRFTAAPVEGGLFDSAPIWRFGNGNVELWWRITNYEPWEAALLLHLLKDLWTEDLPLGGEKNVGRGLLVGQHATIQAPGIDAKLQRKGNGLSIQGFEQLGFLNQDLKTLISNRKKEAQP